MNPWIPSDFLIGLWHLCAIMIGLAVLMGIRGKREARAFLNKNVKP